MKLNQVKFHCINAASPAALDTAITAWLQSLTGGQAEASFMSVDYCESAGNYSVLITYTL